MIELIKKTAPENAPEIGGSLTLTFERRQKSRQRARLDSGTEIAILLPRGSQLRDGDLLQDSHGFCVQIVAAPEPVSCARSADLLRLARACYHLGNRHVSVQVGPGWIRYGPDHVLDEMVRGLDLTVSRELLPFEPESGAYSGSRDGHHHHNPEPDLAVADNHSHQKAAP
ncbi:MAG: urease accessory protein UreE [Gammaproteobacteria bacterium]|nr:urease accessory protein UreE [Gammaproteobacteria bacterium]